MSIQDAIETIETLLFLRGELKIDGMLALGLLALKQGLSGESPEEPLEQAQRVLPDLIEALKTLKALEGQVDNE